MDFFQLPDSPGHLCKLLLETSGIAQGIHPTLVLTRSYVELPDLCRHIGQKPVGLRPGEGQFVGFFRRLHLPVGALKSGDHLFQAAALSAGFGIGPMLLQGCLRLLLKAKRR